MSSFSLRTRLLTGLLASLTVVVAAGCAGIYWLQHELLLREFDGQLGRKAMTAFREVRRPPSTQPARGAEPAEVPEGLVFLQTWDVQTGIRERAVPASLNLGDKPIVPPPETDQPEFRTANLPDGRSVRIFAWRMGIGRPPRRPPPWDPNAHRSGPPPWDPNARRPEGDGGGGPRPWGRRGPESPPQDPNARRIDPDGGEPWHLAGRGGPSESPRDPDGRRRDFDGPDGPRMGGGYRPWPQPRERLYLAAADLAPVQAAMGQWLLRLLAAGAVGEALVAAVVLIAVQRGLRPLRILSADIASIGDGDLRRRVSVRQLPGEVKPVLQQINALLGRLQDAFDRERAFTASAAHEFRTPLAGIRVQMEVCLRRPRGAEEYQATLAQCLQGAVSLQHMVDLLLDLAHLDGGEVKPTAEIVDVPALVKEEWGRLEPMAASRSCTLQAELPERLSVSTDRFMLERIIYNLLANAAEYADPGGRIAVSAQGNGGGLRLCLRNPAAGLEPADVDKLFDRFWRKDAARSSTGNHCGLGLSLVKRCVHVLGGRIAARLDDGGILSFTLELPACEG